ncbi:MAG: hypothetical protein JHC93_00850 [Parachlamydiales bacterium]|nr:hypothetical protein [Parachlamydiales bacterium]
MLHQLDLFILNVIIANEITVSASDIPMPAKQTGDTDNDAIFVTFKILQVIRVPIEPNHRAEAISEITVVGFDLNLTRLEISAELYEGGL